MKNCIQCVCLLVLFCFYVQSAKDDCNDVFDSLPNQLSVREDVTGEQFSVPFNTSEKWGMDVVQINTNTNIQRGKNFILSHFSLVVNTATGILSLSISQPLDLEDMVKYIKMNISSIVLRLSCDTNNTREIPVIVIPVIEFPPEFMEKPYSVSIPENQAIGTSIFEIKSKVKSLDVRDSSGFSFYIGKYTTDSTVDGSQYFTIDFASKGIVTVKKNVDYDALIKNRKPTYFMLLLIAEGLTSLQSKTTLNITITDDDDQGPLFSICSTPCRDSYRATTQTAYRGPLTVRPIPLTARDPDSFNNTIIYDLEPVAFNRDNTFSIDRLTGQVSQIGDVASTGILTVKATENSAKSLTEFTTILVSLGNDTTGTPPPPEEKSTKEDDSGNMKLILIIVGVLALILIVGLIIAFVIYHKKTSKTVQPADDGTDDSSISHSQNWQGSKTELLGNELNPAMMATLQGRGGALPPLTKDSATGTGKKRSRRRNKNKEPEIFDGTREYEGALDMDFFNDANTKSKIKQSTRSRDTKTDPKYWITITNDDD